MPTWYSYLTMIALSVWILCVLPSLYFLPLSLTYLFLTHYILTSLTVTHTSLLPASPCTSPTLRPFLLSPSLHLTFWLSGLIPFHISLCQYALQSPSLVVTTEAEFYYGVRADWEGKCFMRTDLKLGRQGCILCLCVCMWRCLHCVYLGTSVSSPSN